MDLMFTDGYKRLKTNFPFVKMAIKIFKEIKFQSSQQD